jgi:hypothetical protein
MVLMYIVDKTFVIEKIEGKGGWHYVKIPDIRQHKNRAFGMVRVKGLIDNVVEIKQYNLMPMGDGVLFLPLKATIRKALKKQVGDSVHIQLALDDSKVEIPQEFLDCLADEPKALHFFETLTENQQKYFSDWIYAAKQVSTRENRMVEAIEMLANGKKMFEPNSNIL